MKELANSKAYWLHKNEPVGCVLSIPGQRQPSPKCDDCFEEIFKFWGKK